MRAAAALLLVCVVLAPGVARADSEPVASQPPAPSASGYGGVLAWSRLDMSTGRYVLMARHDGVTEQLPVASRGVPFDVDLGPDAAGNTVAVYTRCQRDPPAGVLLFYRTGAGCRIVRYRFDTQTEGPVDVPLPAGGSAFLPSIWGDRIAYAVGFGASFTATRLPELYVREADGTVRRVSGGPAGGRYINGPAMGPTSLDLRDDGLLLTWWSNAATKRCGYDGPVTTQFPSFETLVAVDAPGVPQRVLAHSGCPEDGGSAALAGASWAADGGMAWVSHDASGQPFSMIERHDGAGALTGFARSIPYVGSYARDGAGHELRIESAFGAGYVANFDPVAFAAPTVPAPAPPILDDVHVSGYAGRLAWSAYDPAIGRYRLMSRRAGIDEAVPVATRSVPFDVDLGPDRAGRTVAVYSRCAHETQSHLEPFDYAAATGCHLYEYRFGAGAERRLAVAVPRGSSPVLPTIWRDRLAYAAAFGPGAGRPLPRLFIRGDGRPHVRVPGGPRGGYYQGYGQAQGPVGLDLRGDRLLLAWWSNAGPGPRCSYDGPIGLEAPSYTSFVAVDRPHRPQRRVLHGGCDADGEVDALRAPSWLDDGRVAVVLSRRRGPTADSVRRVDLRTGAAEAWSASERVSLVGYAEDGAGGQVLAGWESEPFVRFDPLAFAPLPSARASSPASWR